MRISLLSIIWVFFVIIPFTTLANSQEQTDIDTLRNEIQQLRQDYENRIRELEKRVSATEQQVPAPMFPAQQSAPTVMEVPSSVNRGIASDSTNVFNPAIGVIFQGQAWDYRRDPESHKIPGFPLGGEAGPVTEGLGLGETEIDISANVDDKFTAWLTLPVVIEDSEVVVEIEEAWIETTALPAGLAARAGRMFSGIGYMNSRHSHSWDFLDQPLVYQAFLGNQYLDDGVQMRWLAPTDLYLELGAEVLRGDRYPAGGATDSGFGVHTVFAHTGGDLGDSSSWQAGLSYLHSGSDTRTSGNEDEPLLFSGDTDMVIADFVWKWAPNGNWKQKNFILQSEYLWRQEDGNYTLPDGRILPYDNDQNGWYLQAIYQPFPQWRVGVRYDMLSSDNPGPVFAGTDLEPIGSDPKRFSIMADWSNSEFSRLRFQYSRDESGRVNDNQWGLQYIHSIGAHGAHIF